MNPADNARIEGKGTALPSVTTGGIAPSTRRAVSADILSSQAVLGELQRADLLLRAVIASGLAVEEWHLSQKPARLYFFSE